MTSARPLPTTGDVFLDTRGPDRALRVSWHFDADLVNLSLWQGNLCTGSFRLPVDQVPALVDLLRSGLEASRAVAATRRHAG